ncbi:MAG: DUF1579 domain-containing protein [Chloroflexi bacterium]|nr:DUF1579 domain-containing protein [Chloroflexota bacterium]MCC6894759.1 DUF1579 family protein [Anaerolineae bacterium]
MAKNEAEIPNPKLQPFSKLIGEWTTVATHRLMPNVTLHGRTTFSWLQGGAFVNMQSEVDEEGVPSATAIFGSDNDTEAFFMLYFDERGVSRKFDVTMQGNVLAYERLVPDFSQRFTSTISDDGNTIKVLVELREDGVNWKNDLEATYTRVK